MKATASAALRSVPRGIRCRLCSCSLGPREPLDRHLLLESCIEAQAARLAALEQFCAHCGGPLDFSPAGPPKSRLCPACRHRRKFPEATPKPLTGAAPKTPRKDL